MAYVLEHTRLGFCWLDLIALAVLVLVVVIFVRKRRAMIREEEELEAQVSGVYAEKAVDAPDGK